MLKQVQHDEFQSRYWRHKMADIQSLVDQLSELTVLEAADLAKALEERWGVSAAAAVAVAGPAAGGGAAAPAARRGRKGVGALPPLLRLQLPARLPAAALLLRPRKKRPSSTSFSPATAAR